VLDTLDERIKVHLLDARKGSGDSGADQPSASQPVEIATRGGDSIPSGQVVSPSGKRRRTNSSKWGTANSVKP
jgi:hypothetical protein